MQEDRKSLRSIVVGAAVSCLLLSAPAQASHFHRGPTASKAHKSKHAASNSAGRPRAIDDARATQIQTALVKAGYLQSSSGHWDESSADAMRKLQSDNGWQTKIIPDSRALIKLGLGPGADTPAPASGAASEPGGSSALAAHTATPNGQL